MTSEMLRPFALCIFRVCFVGVESVVGSMKVIDGCAGDTTGEGDTACTGVGDTACTGRGDTA